MEKKKREGGEEAGWNLHPGVGELKEKRDSRIWGKPLSDRETDWDRREAFEASGRKSGPSAADRTE